MKIEVKIRRGVMGGYWASCSALPGCTAHGDTPEEAKHKLQEAIQGYLGSLNAVPSDRFRLAGYIPSETGSSRYLLSVDASPATLDVV